MNLKYLSVRMHMHTGVQLITMHIDDKNEEISHILFLW